MHIGHHFPNLPNFDGQNQLNNNSLPMKYALSSHSYAFNRRSKQGDWICLKCANYNYSFRQVCNRCQQQERDLNQHWLNLLGVVHYGELSFPSALFLTNENNLYYKTHHESQENPETSPEVTATALLTEWPVLTPSDNHPPLRKQRPNRATRKDPKKQQKKPSARQGMDRPGQQQLTCRKWINELLD